MNLTASILNYKRYLKRKNFSTQSTKSYLSRLKHYLVWLPVPVEIATKAHVKMYLDLLLENCMAPKTINERLVAIRSFYKYLVNEEDRAITNPVSQGMALRLPNPPRQAPDAPTSIFEGPILALSPGGARSQVKLDEELRNMRKQK